MEIIGYYIDPDFEPSDPLNAIVVIDKVKRGVYSFYNCIDGHGQINEEYLVHCKKITFDEYKNATYRYYTPSDYLPHEETLYDF